MKRTVTVLVVLLMLSAALLAAADNALVEYVEGFVEVQDGGTWYEVFIGDEIPADATIRISGHGYAELAVAGSSIQLSRDGTYRVESLIASATSGRSARGRSAAGNLINRLSTERDQAEVAVGGVRASRAVDDSTNWAGGDIAEYIEVGIDAIIDGDYGFAYDMFAEAWDYASADEEPVVVFYMGYASNYMGATREALDYLTMFHPDADSDYYDDHVLALASLYVDTFAFADALELIEAYIGAAEHELNVQLARYLGGLSHLGLGNTEQALEQLTAAAELGASESISAEATALIAEL